MIHVYMLQPKASMTLVMLLLTYASERTSGHGAGDLLQEIFDITLTSHSPPSLSILTLLAVRYHRFAPPRTRRTQQRGPQVWVPLTAIHVSDGDLTSSQLPRSVFLSQRTRSIEKKADPRRNSYSIVSSHTYSPPRIITN